MVQGRFAFASAPLLPSYQRERLFNSQAIKDITMLKTRLPAPALSFPLAGGGTWTLADRKPEHFTMVVFYRGLHCPICSRYLKDLESKMPQFMERGVDVVAVSTDQEDRAAQAKADWGLDKLALGYGVSIEKAREWGLYISTSRGKTSVGIEEPEMFAEPGLFVMKPDTSVYFVSVQSMPFARPAFQDVLGAMNFAIEKNYPARGHA